jgi:hypothetical protein
MGAPINRRAIGSGSSACNEPDFSAAPRAEVMGARRLAFAEFGDAGQARDGGASMIRIR